MRGDPSERALARRFGERPDDAGRAFRRRADAWSVRHGASATARWRGRRSAAPGGSATQRSAGPAMPIRTGFSMPRWRSRLTQPRTASASKQSCVTMLTPRPVCAPASILASERAVERVLRQSRMAFRVSRNGDLAKPCALQEPALDQFERAAERSFRMAESPPTMSMRRTPAQRVSRDSTSSSAAWLSMSRAARCGTGSSPCARTRTAASIGFAIRTARERR